MAGLSMVNGFEFIAFKGVLGLRANACFSSLSISSNFPYSVRFLTSDRLTIECCRWANRHDGGEKMKEIFVNSELPKKLAVCLNTVSPSCKQAARLQSKGLIQPLSWSERLGLRVHLLICGWCRRFGEQTRFLNSATHQCPERERASALPGLPTEGRERIKRAMQASRSDKCCQANLTVAAPEVQVTNTLMAHGDGNLLCK
jgi:hypothetical protein